MELYDDNSEFALLQCEHVVCTLAMHWLHLVSALSANVYPI